jgi:hypothetical protein
MTIPATCPDFVSHPHLIEGRNCYTCKASACSEEQGTSAIAEALNKIGIPADVHQTGGFTMCAHIKTGAESYIYATTEGFSFYNPFEDGFLDLREFDFSEDQTPEEMAQDIAETMKNFDLIALPI